MLLSQHQQHFALPSAAGQHRCYPSTRGLKPLFASTAATLGLRQGHCKRPRRCHVHASARGGQQRFPARFPGPVQADQPSGTSEPAARGHACNDSTLASQLRSGLRRLSALAAAALVSWSTLAPPTWPAAARADVDVSLEAHSQASRQPQRDCPTGGNVDRSHCLPPAFLPGHVQSSATREAARTAAADAMTAGSPSSGGSFLGPGKLLHSATAQVRLRRGPLQIYNHVRGAEHRERPHDCAIRPSIISLKLRMIYRCPGPNAQGLDTL